MLCIPSEKGFIKRKEFALKESKFFPFRVQVDLLSEGTRCAGMPKGSYKSYHPCKEMAEIPSGVSVPLKALLYDILNFEQVCFTTCQCILQLLDENKMM